MIFHHFSVNEKQREIGNTFKTHKKEISCATYAYDVEVTHKRCGVQNFKQVQEGIGQVLKGRLTCWCTWDHCLPAPLASGCQRVGGS